MKPPTKKQMLERWGTPAEKRAAVLQHMDAFDSLHRGQPNFYGMVRRLGREYRAAPRPAGMRKQPNKMCFRNAALLAMAHPEKYTYVEGIACHSIPMLHAWCVLKDGTVVDPTWHWPELCAYYGIPFDDATLRRELLKNRVFGLLDNHDTVKNLMQQPEVA